MGESWRLVQGPCHPKCWCPTRAAVIASPLLISHATSGRFREQWSSRSTPLLACFHHKAPNKTRLRRRSPVSRACCERRASGRSGECGIFREARMLGEASKRLAPKRLSKGEVRLVCRPNSKFTEMIKLISSAVIDFSGSVKNLQNMTTRQKMNRSDRNCVSKREKKSKIWAPSSIIEKNSQNGRLSWNIYCVLLDLFFAELRPKFQLIAR